MFELFDLYLLRLLRYFIYIHVCLDFGFCVRRSVYFLNICYICVFYRFNRNRALQKTKSTGRIPSRWETIDSENPDSQCSQVKSKVPKSKGARLCTYSRTQASTPTSIPKPYLNIPYISQIPMIVRPYIEDIVNVKGDGNCGFWVIARHLGMDEENHVLVHADIWYQESF
jgi:hypothetical protein